MDFLAHYLIMLQIFQLLRIERSIFEIHNREIDNLNCILLCLEEKKD